MQTYVPADYNAQTFRIDPVRTLVLSLTLPKSSVDPDHNRLPATISGTVCLTASMPAHVHVYSQACGIRRQLCSDADRRRRRIQS
jgi:hypothetical protein